MIFCRFRDKYKISFLRKSFLLKVLIIITFSVLLLPLIIFLSCVFLFFPYDYLIFSSARIILPKGKFLRSNINSFIYRNGSLVGHSSNIIILKKKKNFLRSFNVLGNEGDDSQVISFFSLGSDEIEAKCEGICECYVEENERKSIENVVYSHKFTSFVVVATLTWATAKFVTENIDSCYNLAANALGETESSVTCSIEKPKCEGREDRLDKDEESRVYKCLGHCFTKKYTNPFSLRAASRVTCERRYADEIVFRVKKEETYGHSVWGKAARDKYQKHFLSPYCKSIKAIFRANLKYKSEPEIDFKAWESSGRGVKKLIFPCAGSTRQNSVNKNVECVEINEYYDPK